MLKQLTVYYQVLQSSLFKVLDLPDNELSI